MAEAAQNVQALSEEYQKLQAGQYSRACVSFKRLTCSRTAKQCLSKAEIRIPATGKQGRPEG